MESLRRGKHEKHSSVIPKEGKHELPLKDTIVTAGYYRYLVKAYQLVDRP